MRLLKSCVIDVDLIIGVYILGYIYAIKARTKQITSPLSKSMQHKDRNH